VRSGSSAADTVPSSAASKTSPFSVSNAHANQPSAKGSASCLWAICANASPNSPWVTRVMSARIVAVMAGCT
jgi:hypothetical protein